MIKYSLKNSELQCELTRLFPWFSDELQKQCEKWYADPFRNYDYVTVGNLPYDTTIFPEKAIRFEIAKKDIKVVKDYDPNGWKDYPDEIPPIGVILQVEGHFKGAPYYAAVKYTGRNFYRVDSDFNLSPFVIIKRFRLWDAK